MNKCPKCGTEFEGNFCPECGTPSATEKYCASCGAKLSANVRFCTRCGRAVDEATPAFPATTAIQTEHRRTTMKKIDYLRLVPAALLFLFSVLCFLFFLAPYATIPGEKLSGKTLPDVDLGSLYFYLGDGGKTLGLSALPTAILVFTVLALLCSVITFFGSLLPLLNHGKEKQVLIGKRPYPVFHAVSIFGAGIGYTALIICGAVGAALISEFGKIDGLGSYSVEVIRPGAALILLLTFASLFLVATAIAVYLEYAHWKSGVFSAFRAKHPDIELPTVPKEILDSPITQELKKNNTIGSFFILATLPIILFGLALPWNVLFSNKGSGNFISPLEDIVHYMSDLPNMLISIVIITAYFGVAILLSVLFTSYLARSYLHFSCEKFRKRCIHTSKTRKAAIGLYAAAICLLVAPTIFFAIPKINEEFLSKGFEFFTVYAAVPFLYYLLGFIIPSALLLSLKLQRLVFGTKIVTNATPLTQEAQKYADALREYNAQKEKYVKAIENFE